MPDKHDHARTVKDWPTNTLRRKLIALLRELDHQTERADQAEHKLTRYVTRPEKRRSKTDSTTEPPLRLYALCPCQVCQNTGRDAAGDRCSQCRGEGKVRVRVACADTPAELGVKLVEHAREGAWADGCQFGLLDADAEEGSGLRWLILPWQASPTARNAADAARVLAGKRWK